MLSQKLFFATSADKKAQLGDYWKIRDLLYKKYDGDIDSTKLVEGSKAGLVASLGDPYTTYLDAKASKELADDLKGTLSGIGIEIGIKNNKLTVIAPIDGTPAALAGLKSGDTIAAIDGVDASTYTLDEAVTKIRGNKGTEVKLTIVRGSSSPKELKITRDTINVPSVKSEIKDGNIGYIKIRRFSEDTTSLMTQAANQFTSAKVHSVVIDLRDDPGGYLDSSVTVTSQFLKSGTVVEERSKFKDNKKLSATGSGQLTDIPVVVLINGGSASAAEIMAGALHDNNRATLVGEKTYGKGSVQEVVGLDKGANLKITVAHWYTPKGINISKEGIKPDIEIKNPATETNPANDPQLNKALEIAHQS